MRYVHSTHTRVVMYYLKIGSLLVVKYARFHKFHRTFENLWQFQFFFSFGRVSYFFTLMCILSCLNNFWSCDYNTSFYVFLFHFHCCYTIVFVAVGFLSPDGDFTIFHLCIAYSTSFWCSLIRHEFAIYNVGYMVLHIRYQN